MKGMREHVGGLVGSLGPSSSFCKDQKKDTEHEKADREGGRGA